jgi:Holliday junction resolvase RusA-like endonuclease
MVSIFLPIYWTRVFKTKPSKTVLVGINWFRNAFHIEQNQFKQEFTDLVLPQVSGSALIDTAFQLDITLFYKNSNCDASNITALMEKVSLDAFKKAGVIIDDNVKHHVGTTWRVAGKDATNPRCEISIIPTQGDIC